jgi:hypothetical protein
MINNTSTTDNTYAPLDFKCGTNNVWGRIAYKATDMNDEFGQFEFITVDDGQYINALTVGSSGNVTTAGSLTPTSGIYLGGTGSANHLDDYEEGTWTPSVSTVSGFTVGASSSYSGTYVKIGKKVFISAKLDFDGNGDNVALGDYAVLSGIPFNPVHAFDGEGVFHVAVNASTNRGATGTAYNISNNLYLWTTHVGSSSTTWASTAYVQMAFETT